MQLTRIFQSSAHRCTRPALHNWSGTMCFNLSISFPIERQTSYSRLNINSKTEMNSWNIIVLHFAFYITSTFRILHKELSLAQIRPMNAVICPFRILHTFREMYLHFGFSVDPLWLQQKILYTEKTLLHLLISQLEC